MCTVTDMSELFRGKDVLNDDSRGLCYFQIEPLKRKLQFKTIGTISGDVQRRVAVAVIDRLEGGRLCWG
jgi:hypothetical protein